MKKPRRLSTPTFPMHVPPSGPPGAVVDLDRLAEALVADGLVRAVHRVRGKARLAEAMRDEEEE